MWAILILAAQLDTLELPEPAAAIAVDENNRLAYVTVNADELIRQDIDDAGVSWQTTPLPRTLTILDRILLAGDRCYLLSQRELILCDLRNQKSSVIAEDVDDAVLAAYGELWISREFTLIRTTLLGRELEKRKLLREPSSMWMIDDSLALVYPDDTLLMPSWFEEIASGLDTAQLAEIHKLLVQPDPARLATNRKAVYIMIDPRHVIGIGKP